ncbi:MAG: TlpA disulfide reductase family protein [Acidobacteriota bacterium]
MIRLPARWRGAGRRGTVAGLLAAALLGGSTALGATEGSIWRTESFTDMEGRTYTADQLDGRVVLLDFWATWCAPCLAELPHLKALQDRHGDDGLLILGIALDAIERRDLRSFLLRHGVHWPQIHLRDGTQSETAQRFGIEAVPATVLVDRRGRLVARDLRGEALAKVVGTLVQLGE